MKIKVTILMVMFALTTSTLATPQIPETIIINGQERDLLSYPLDAYLERLDKQPEVVGKWQSTDLYRCYVGTWIIKEKHLWLKSYQTLDEGGAKLEKRSLAKLNKWWWRGPVKADWYSGDLYVVYGKEIPPENDLFGGVPYEYEKYLQINVNKGAVEQIRVIDTETKRAIDQALRNKPPISVIGPDEKLKTIEYQRGWYAGTDDVAHMHGITVEAFRKLNGLASDEELEPGAKVKVPCAYQ